jgi:hypothetical protein
MSSRTPSPGWVMVALTSMRSVLVTVANWNVGLMQS